MRPYPRAVAMSLLLVLLGIGYADAQPSINSTSRNRATLPPAPVKQKPRVSLPDFQIVAANDLGMHCGDLDHRIASVLPPFNVLHAQVIGKDPGPRILTGSDANVFYSAASNPKDPALQRPPDAPVFKTNFWNKNARTGHVLAFDAYNPFYPPGVLAKFPLRPDVGLPVPDLETFYLGSGALLLDQQAMPSVRSLNPYTSDPYVTNVPERFALFYTDFPFFIGFPFGYTLLDWKWFSAEGVPVPPTDDFGRLNPYPLMRIQARDRTGSLTGTRGQVLASVDTVLPVSGEANCFTCHTSAVDGGNGQAACLPGFDPNCPNPGSPTNRSGVAFDVATASEDTAKVPFAVHREWAADWNIVRLHDAKHGTRLGATTPVVCQRCHYSPALDLAHVGPLGPGDPSANGREQKIHHTNSRGLHTFHSSLDLFKVAMPPPNSPRRLDPVTGKPVINAFVLGALDQTCYQCHPGKTTRCLRGAMFNGGIVCQDCHGSMRQVGNDFSARFPVVPFPGGADLTKRIPWATEPGCQSCHTGDALTSIARTDPNVIPAADGIRLLQAYRTNDPNAKAVEAPNSRFAENQATNGNRVLYRLSKDTHAGIFCEGCHGSTHANWPVLPASGATIANDNVAPIQLQGHAGTITECTACHLAGSLPVSLDGPHGMHPVNDQNWVNGHEGFLETNPLRSCRTCHALRGGGTVLSKAAVARTFTVEGAPISIAAGQLVGCNLCHGNPLGTAEKH